MENINLKVDLAVEDIYKFQKAYLKNNISLVSIVVIGLFVLALLIISITSISEGDFSISSMAGSKRYS